MRAHRYLLPPLCAVAACAAVLPKSADWTTWSPRPEIAPRTFVDAIHYRTRPGSLAICGNSNPAAYGGWQRHVPVEAGKWYRFAAYYRTEGVPFERFQVVSRLEWKKANGKRAGQPDYPYAVSREGEWNRVSLEAPAPEGAVSVTLDLYLANAPTATVYWDDISFDAIAAPAPRPVRVAALNYRPKGGKSAAENVDRFVAAIDAAVPGKADLIVLPEGITVVGTGKKYADVAESIPGPTTLRLGEEARKKNSYIVAGIYEREGTAVYNTAVLVDRAGNVTGKYRKVYIPREEMEAGLTPGSGYPVFRTDFGKVGMMICWDVQYTDPARALALRGAELILMPIWGGNEALGKARAIENHVFLISSGYDYPTYVMDPNGEILSQAPQGQAALATVDLNRRYDDSWLGNMRERFMKEVRLDVK